MLLHLSALFALAFVLHKANASYDAFDADFGSDSNSISSNAAAISSTSTQSSTSTAGCGGCAASYAVANTTITCQAGPTAAVVVPGHYVVVTKTRSVTCTAKPTSSASSSIGAVSASSRCQCGCKRSREEARARKRTCHGSRDAFHGAAQEEEQVEYGVIGAAVIY